jgi:hypothetical protein
MFLHQQSRSIWPTGLLFAMTLTGLGPVSANVPSESVVCTPHQIAISLMGIRQTGQGKISVDIQYENMANFPYQLNAAGGVHLIDSNGEEWYSVDRGNNLSRTKMSPNIKYKHTYDFIKRVGGTDVTSVTFTHHFRVWQGKQLGTCDFDAKEVVLKQ